MGAVTQTASQIAGGGLRIADNILGTRMSGGNAYSDALDAQGASTGQANQALTDAYRNQQTYLNPYNQAGNNALGQLSSGNLVNASTLTSDPGYQFRLSEGLNAINSNAAAKGGLNSGATLKALTQYGQNFASNEYNNAYNREYNRLSQLAGYGFNSASGLANASGQLGSNLSNNYMGLGNAAAASNMAVANNQNQLISSGIGAYGRSSGSNANSNSGGGAGGSSFWTSDQRLKTNISEISKDELDEMKKYLKAFAWNYKSDEHGTGDWIGVMAQDLEKSKLGKTLVVENEKGEKMIDLKKVLSMFLATMAEA